MDGMMMRDGALELERDSGLALVCSDFSSPHVGTCNSESRIRGDFRNKYNLVPKGDNMRIRSICMTPIFVQRSLD
jgi:hypothetical protein